MLQIRNEFARCETATGGRNFEWINEGINAYSQRWRVVTPVGYRDAN